jgi:SAM-dependent methyltransferase
VSQAVGEPGGPARRFRAAYAEHRRREGRGDGGADELLALPYIEHGSLAAQWRVRARTYERFLRTVLNSRADEVGDRPLHILDLGAGNGWLCYRLCRLGQHAVALDWRSDTVDGLGATAAYGPHLPQLFPRVAAPFDALPFRHGTFDIAVFNASLHYCTDLHATIAEATRVMQPGGRVAVLDSPFYRRAQDGEAMVAQKHRGAADEFGSLRDDLLALPSIEFLTDERLSDASDGLNLVWRRHRVRYPWWYELRPLWAALRRRRRPSRFDVWEGRLVGGANRG